MIEIPKVVLQDITPRKGPNWSIRDHGRVVYQRRPQLPGLTKDPAMVLADWLTGREAWAVWGGRSAFVFVANSIASKYDGPHLADVLSLRCPDPVDSRAPIVQRASRAGEAPAEVSAPSDGPPPAMPEGLWEGTAHALQKRVPRS